MSDIVESLREGCETDLVFNGDYSELQVSEYATNEKMNKAADEITRLRTELAEVRAKTEEIADDWRDTNDMLIRAVAERDTLRQQLAVAREGLGWLDKESSLSPDWPGREVIRDTLAKMDQMEKP